jgi:peptide deformylase
MFAILKEPLIQIAQWNNYPPIDSTDYEIIINPQLKEESNLRLKDFEECPSLPGLRFHIWNPVSQLYNYLSPTVHPSGDISL